MLKFIYIIIAFHTLSMSSALAIKLSKSFESKLGYSVSYPDCFSITTLIAYDDPKNIESLDDIYFDPGASCTAETKSRIFSFSSTPEYSKPPTHKNLDQIIKDTKLTHKLGGTQYLSAELIGLKSGEAVLTVTEIGSKSLRWQVWIPCNDKMFKFVSTMKDDTKAKNDFTAIIKKDPNFIPEPERSVIDSFSCK